MHVVVFPGWYPNRLDKLSGDFIQRHLIAVSKYCRVTAIIPVKDSTISKAETVTVVRGNLTEIYYYYPSASSIKAVDNLLSFIRYNYICISKTKGLHRNEKLSLVHLYVLQKNHLLGVMLKLLLGLRYVISEQSTLYVDGRFEKMNVLQQKLWRYTFNHATAYHAVSSFLATQIKSKLHLHNNAVVIPNVVDTNLFHYKPHQPDSTTHFVHVSNMVYQKNVEGMLRAFAEVKKKNSNFILNLVGPIPSHVAELIKMLDIQAEVKVWNERSYNEVAEIMQQGEAFVFFTRYETFGCVTIEANACGLPVIISDLDVSKELVENYVNGLLVKSEDVNDLAVKLSYFMNNKDKFNAAAISHQTRELYNYEAVGKRLAEWYHSITGGNIDDAQ